MNKIFEYKDLQKLNNSQLKDVSQSISFDFVSIDSRTLERGDAFVAFKGDNFDGADYIDNAIDKGASIIITDFRRKERYDKYAFPFVYSEDPIKVYGQLANFKRNKLGYKVISITGSNGKTTSKEYTAALLKNKFKVHKTEANNNNHIGVPLTIHQAPVDAEVLVLEQGTNQFGEIEYSASVSEPDLALITNIGDSHLEFLINREGVLKEKKALSEASFRRGGLTVYNSDDPLLFREFKSKNDVISFGIKNDAFVKGDILGFDEFGKVVLSVKLNKQSCVYELPFAGINNAYNFLAAVSLVSCLGITLCEIKESVKNIEQVKGRLQTTYYNNFMLIEDWYNANPDSMKSSISLMKNITGYKRKIAVLGDMFEMGSNSKDHHRSLSEVIKYNEIEEIITIGNDMKYLSEALNDNVEVNKHFDSREELSKFLRELNINNSVILVKGSRGMHMEEFANIIKMRIH